MTLPRRDGRTAYAIVVADGFEQRGALSRLARSAGSVACVCGDMGSVMANANPADPPAYILTDLETASRMDWQVCRQMRFPQNARLNTSSRLRSIRTPRARRPTPPCATGFHS